MLRELFSSPKPKKAAPAPAKPAAPAPVSQSVLAVGTRFEGTLRADGHVRVDGIFIGNISARGRIAVGEHGKVEGDLVGEAVDVAGTVKGDVVARRISVMRTGRILGDLRLEKLLTEEGGFIQGLVRMEEKVNMAEYLPKAAPVEEPPAPDEPVKESPQAEAMTVKAPVKTSRS